MKTLIIVACLTVALATPSLAETAAPAIKQIDQQMTLARDGAATVTARIDLANLRAGAFDVPMAAWGDVQGFRATGGPEALRVTPNLRGLNPRLTLAVPDGGLAALALEVTFALPAPPPAAAGNYRILAHRILNSSLVAIDRYRLTVTLPEGEVVHAVPEALPRPRPAEVTPRVQLGARDGRHQVAFNMTNMRFGDQASMRVEVQGSRRSIVPLLAGLGLSALFLFGFRSLIHQSEEPAGREHHSHRAHE